MIRAKKCDSIKLECSEGKIFQIHSLPRPNKITRARELLSSRWNVIKSKSARRGNVEFFSAACKRSLQDFNFKLALLTIILKNHLILEMIKRFCSQCKREKLKLLLRSDKIARERLEGEMSLLCASAVGAKQMSLAIRREWKEKIFSRQATHFSSRSRSMPFLLALICSTCGHYRKARASR